MCDKEMTYEWCSGEQYSKRISSFLKAIDEIMIPRLSQRVDINEYACKLACNADTIFIKKEGEDIGSCSLYCNCCNAFISSIAVKKEFVNNHIATKLLEEVIQHAKGRECVKISLEVYNKNIAAVRLYQKAGFCIVNKNGSWEKMEINLKNGEDIK